MRRRSLRLRLLVTFGLGSLALSSLFASLTFFGVQHVLTSNQQQTDLKQSYVDAALVRSTLYTAPLQLANELNSIERATTSNVLVQTHNQWLSKSNGAATNDVSFPIIKTVSDGHATEQTLDVNGQIIFVVGVPIPAVETQFFEVFQLKDLEHTLRAVGRTPGRTAAPASLERGSPNRQRRALHQAGGRSGGPRGPTTHRVVQRHGESARRAPRTRRALRQ